MFELMEKARNKKGFTLMEMLIVVAIIAILVAIIIPVFSAQMEKARIATDAANIRSAYAMAQSCTLMGVDPTGETNNDNDAWTLEADGEFVKTSTDAYTTQADGDPDDCPVYGSWAKGDKITIKPDATDDTAEWTVTVSD